MEIKVKKLDPEAKLPEYAHPGDAGMDLFALEDTVLNPGQLVQIRTGLVFEFNTGYVGLIWDKGGPAHKHGLKTMGGVLDAGYRGELLVGMINLSKQEYTFSKGQKVAQMLIQKVELPEIIETEELSNTSRGAGAFGSTGK